MSSQTMLSLEKAQSLLLDLLDQQDYFNVELMDQIQRLVIGHDQYFQLQCWQDLLKQDTAIRKHFTDFLKFYLEFFPKIQQGFELTMVVQMQKFETVLQKYQNSMTVDDQTETWNQLQSDSEMASIFQEQSGQEQLIYLNYWLQAFSPFAEQNVSLFWQVFQIYPMETFELLLQLPRSYLKAENIEIFYQLFKEEKLSFATAGIRPTQYIQYFYDQFPEFLMKIPQRFLQTSSSHLKEKLIGCLSDRPVLLAESLQQFILDTFIEYAKHSNQSIFNMSLDALAQCKTIIIPTEVIQNLKDLLHDDEVWFRPMSAMRALHGIGVQDQWFKDHLLDALNHAYGCDDESPQSTSIDLLVQWQEKGLYVADKITQLLNEAIAENDQDVIKNLCVYLDAYPQLASHFQPILWQWIESLNQQPQGEYWLDGKILKTFLQLSEWVIWQPNTQQWQSLETVLHEILEYLSPEDREEYFESLIQNLKLDRVIIQDLKQYYIVKDQENHAENQEN